MPDRGPNQRRVVILNAIRVELEAVCAHLQGIYEETHRGTIYRRGTFSDGTYSWDVVVVQTGRGGYGAATETERAISLYHPDLILFVGVAGGRKDVKHGDVVAATKVYAYESGKADEIFQTRPEVGRPSYRLEQRAEAEAVKKDWLKRLGDKLPDPPPSVHVGPIAAGGSVITSLASAIEKLLQASYNDTLAVEMEGHGFLEAVHRADKQVDALIIRGISDLLTDKAEADALHWQEVASRHASTFAFEILAKLEPVDFQQDQYAESGEYIMSSRQLTGSSEKQALEIDLNEQPTELQASTAALEPELSVSSIQVQEAPSSLKNYYRELEKEVERFKSNRIRYPDQCTRIINLMTSLEDFFKTSQKNTPDLGQRKQLSDIREQVSTLKNHLQTFREICEFPRPNQQNHPIRQTIREKFDLLLNDLERVLNDK
jgi:nucleoside phosphorylase